VLLYCLPTGRPRAADAYAKAALEAGIGFVNTTSDAMARDPRTLHGDGGSRRLGVGHGGQFIVDDCQLAPGRENDIVVELASYSSCLGPSVSSANRLLYSAVPLIVGKEVQAVVLPTGGTAKVGIHIFGVGIDNP